MQDFVHQQYQPNYVGKCRPVPIERLGWYLPKKRTPESRVIAVNHPKKNGSFQVGDLPGCKVCPKGRWKKWSDPWGPELNGPKNTMGNWGEITLDIEVIYNPISNIVIKKAHLVYDFYPWNLPGKCFDSPIDSRSTGTSCAHPHHRHRLLAVEEGATFTSPEPWYVHPGDLLYI